jgi:hypothetical protein
MYVRLSLLQPDCYLYLLRCGEAGTNAAPRSQLRGRAGRKCLLEDGERYLRRAIELDGTRPEAYAVLAHNLVEMVSFRLLCFLSVYSNFLSNPLLESVNCC